MTTLLPIEHIRPGQRVLCVDPGHEGSPWTPVEAAFYDRDGSPGAYHCQECAGRTLGPGQALAALRSRDWDSRAHGF